jgi:ribulose-phosphate 3-epimerase
MKNFLIAPSILSADFSRLGEEVDEVVNAGADVIHFDVMDNHFVPNLTVGPMVCRALRDHGVTAIIDVHLMVEPVDQLIASFIDAGADWITFHPEASDDIDRSLQLIRDGGCKGGLAINPETGLDSVKYFLKKIDIILLMSVNPGFGGQKFIPKTLEKLREARSIIDKSGMNIHLEIDGGVSSENIKKIANAGADTFVAGSAIYGADDYHLAINNMRNELSKLEV